MDPGGETAFCLPRSGSLRFIHREYLTAEPLPLPDAEPWNGETDGPEPGRWEYFGHEPMERPPRPPTWRQLMKVLPLDKWLEVMAARQERAQEWRLRQICARSRGDVVDLNGTIRVPKWTGPAPATGQKFSFSS